MAPSPPSASSRVWAWATGGNADGKGNGLTGEGRVASREYAVGELLKLPPPCSGICHVSATRNSPIIHEGATERELLQW